MSRPANKHIIVRGDHDAAGNISIIENDDKFRFVVTVSTDSVEAQINCGEAMSRRQLIALGDKLLKIASTSKSRCR